MKKLFIASLLACVGICAFAQGKTAPEKYRRSSLYSVIATHPSAPYSDEIFQAFMQMPIPDKFNDHNLEVRYFESSAAKMKKEGKKKDAGNLADIEEFIAANQVAKGMVAKWFNRGPEGGFDMYLVQDRGFYDASQQDIENAHRSELDLAILGDAGEDLIGKTFLLVNDITFVDIGKNTDVAAGAIRTAGLLAGAFLGRGVSDLTNVAADATKEFDGFEVDITSYLYQLDWNDEISGTFYKTYWTSHDNADTSRKIAYDQDSNLFTLSYVGKSSTSASIVTSKNFSKKTKSEQMLTVCSRAVDKAIVELQREYDQFKVVTPISSINSDGTVDIQIGLKEGLNEKSVYEVLMPVENEKGQLKYKKVGQLKPVKGKIWDNRFGALDEAQELAAAGKNRPKGDKDAEGGDVYLTASTFKVLNGGNQIALGCVVREEKIAVNKKK